VRRSRHDRDGLFPCVYQVEALFTLEEVGTGSEDLTLVGEHHADAIGDVAGQRGRKPNREVHVLGVAQLDRDTSGELGVRQRHRTAPPAGRWQTASRSILLGTALVT